MILAATSLVKSANRTELSMSALQAAETCTEALSGAAASCGLLTALAAAREGCTSGWLLSGGLLLLLPAGEGS